MVLDISVGTVGAACTVATLAGKIIHSLVAGALEKRDDRIDALEEALKAEAVTRAADIGAAKATQKVLFEKLDHVVRELHDYKLHVAETYIAEDKLEKIIAPVVSRLDRIEDDLRGERARDRERA